LVAILAAGAAGYSHHIAREELGTIAALDAGRDVFKTEIESHQGRVIDMAEDSILASFETAIGAVTAALRIQEKLKELAAHLPDDRQMRFRIGVHVGDIREKDDGTIASPDRILEYAGNGIPSAPSIGRRKHSHIVLQ
jgi:adenylate cyclase